MEYVRLSRRGNFTQAICGFQLVRRDNGDIGHTRGGAAKGYVAEATSSCGFGLSQIR
jgi:hypothetical protein